ncbi:hypothetical protein CXG81DRAFT_10948 [Caulochytrium protostelioides]|uniref:N-acetyltransferase domain-containing protein n=1 Tax=Caulochytrium protostelioides TaxID=1555241 RepID=A0A4P9XA69_9FUNG|nr:hypothetical protein CXG81DRAFT_10948 [Caulochytrium protostelioides]|eukprot:RKP02264.1 hypothetical protein CXG81DRAFT_10948 [Caulochytrium protostelioides]
MRENQAIALQGATCTLVPYRKAHVPRYHAWMNDPQLGLCELTASEPLSLDAEYAMQQTWAEDADKCTFILHAHNAQPATLAGAAGQPDAPTPFRQYGAMVGDVNLFLRDEPLCNEDGDPTGVTVRVAELEIMIAEPDARRRGIGREAVCLMLGYGADQLGLRRFEAKIAVANAASIALFASLGFREVSRSAIFEEVTLRIVLPGDPEAAAAMEVGHDLWRRQLKQDVKLIHLDASNSEA